MDIKYRATKRNKYDWMRSGAIYQIFPDRFARDESVAADRELVSWDSVPTPQNFFGGNLRGITQRLEYIAELGITNMYLNPIFSAHSNHRYDAHSYMEIDPLLGTKEDFRELVTKAKSLGIGVIIDGVFNHVGDHYPDFVAAKNGDKKLAKHFFLYEDGSYQTFGSAQSLPKLNLENADVLKHIADVMKYWDSFGIAGWRFDVPYKVSNKVWKKLRKMTRGIASAQFIVAEAWTDWTFASSFESVQNYKTGNRILDYSVLMRADSEDFILDVVRYADAWSDGSLLWNFVDSHDTARYLTRCENDYEAFLIGFALHMLMPGVPVVYYGTELATPGENDPGCRTTFPQVLNHDQEVTLSYTQRWIQMRQMPALTHGDLVVKELKNHAMVFRRKHGKSKIEVIVNTGYRPELIHSKIDGTWKSVRHEDVEITGNTVPARTLVYRVTE
jgi:cyclomaltodextrinase